MKGQNVIIKVTVIHGCRRGGSTYHCTQQFIEAVRAKTDESLEVSEFFLAQDAPPFCKGCMSCFLNGEGTCPHSEKVQPIVAAMQEADVIVLNSAIYALDVSGQMKTLLDHLCYMWMPHRPNPAMFKKVGVTITTTAGAGLSHATKTLANSLNYWGLLRVFSFKKAISATSWDQITSKKKAKIDREIGKMAGKVVKSVQRANHLRPRTYTRIVFMLMKGMMKNNNWCKRDQNHWKSQGWLDGATPF